jgi:MscS family membrane protein
MQELSLSHIAIIVAALVGAAVLGRLFGHLAAELVCRVTRVHRDAAAQRARVARRLRGPISLVLAIGLWQLALVFVGLPGDARQTLHEIARIGLIIALVWSALRIADLIVEVLSSRTDYFAAHAGSRALLPLARRVANILVAAIAVVALLSSLGYSVTGLVAGLGITGIAVALAAQKTLENVLGAFAIGIDQPLREGDVVKVDQTIGTVERIGLRSTRIRTPDRTLVAYPNGKLADSVIERFSARDRTRFAVRFRIALGTTSDQLRAIRDRIQAVVADHPARAGDKPSVHITGPGDTWFELEAIAWFQTADWDEFQTLRDHLLFDCLDAIADAGATLAGAPAPAPAEAVRTQDGSPVRRGSSPPESTEPGDPSRPRNGAVRS